MSKQDKEEKTPPIKGALVQKENKRKAKAVKNKGKEGGKSRKPQKVDREKVKNKNLQESNDISISGMNTDELCQYGKNDYAEDTVNLCLVCADFDNERWYRCTSCGLWAHANCTGLDFVHNFVIMCGFYVDYRCLHADHHCSRC